VKRKICIFTGTRAEYGLLRPLMQLIKKDKGLKLQLLVSGMHLSREFGLTYKDIKKDSFCISKKVGISLKSDTSIGISKSISLGIAGISKAYMQLKPDIVVILGDRFEAFSAAAAAMISRIPIAHLNGGEATFGLIDEAIRHSITKMSHLHFTSAKEYKKRVMQLGEYPDRVFNVGAIGLDNIRNLKLLSKEALEKKLGFCFNRYNLLVTFHPTTLEKNTSKKQFSELLKALDELKETNLIFTKANADTDGRVINRMIDEYVSRHRQKSVVFTSMGQLRYLSAMKYVDAVVGNSSSGIIEAPSFRIGTINIGDRQKGRIQAKSIIGCRPDTKSIRAAVRKLYSKKFQQSLKQVASPYGDGRTARRIKDVLKNYRLDNILKKSFYNIDPKQRKSRF